MIIYSCRQTASDPELTAASFVPRLWKNLHSVLDSLPECLGGRFPCVSQTGHASAAYRPPHLLMQLYGKFQAFPNYSLTFQPDPGEARPSQWVNMQRPCPQSTTSDSPVQLPSQVSLPAVPPTPAAAPVPLALSPAAAPVPLALAPAVAPVPPAHAPAVGRVSAVPSESGLSGLSGSRGGSRRNRNRAAKRKLHDVEESSGATSASLPAKSARVHSTGLTDQLPNLGLGSQRDVSMREATASVQRSVSVQHESQADVAVSKQIAGPAESQNSQVDSEGDVVMEGRARPQSNTYSLESVPMQDWEKGEAGRN